MKGTVIEQLGAQPKVVDSLERPKPRSDQLLVRSLYLAISPVDGFMANTGLLVTEWPLVIGVDASGVVFECGEEASPKHGFNVGDYVCGCTRLGMKEHAAGQEYFLMDAQVTMHKPKNIDLKQAAALDVGLETAALCVFDGLQNGLLDPDRLPEKKGEWAIVLDGASSVGWYAIQLLKLAGYNILASCSVRSTDTVKALGTEPFDYEQDIDQQLQQVLDITQGNVCRVIDAAASDDPLLAIKLFEHSAHEDKVKLFATTNDWSGIKDFNGGKTYNVELGPVGRPDAARLNRKLERYIPVLAKLVENGHVKVGEYEVVGEGGFDDIAKAYEYKNSGTRG